MSKTDNLEKTERSEKFKALKNGQDRQGFWKRFGNDDER
jgi:hypothetical protein